MAGEHVLVVDDTEMNLKLLDVLLRGRGYTVTTADSAETALLALAKTSFAAILLDLRLPGMDGLSLARLLRKDPSNAHIAIIAVTANAMKGDEEAAIAAGCDAYVTKPIDTRNLPTLIAAEIARKADA
jgi:CheY-like chemotaxis protein